MSCHLQRRELGSPLSCQPTSSTFTARRSRIECHPCRRERLLRSRRFLHLCQLETDADEDARKEIEDNLFLLGKKWSKALHEFKDPVKIKMQFKSKEKHLITQLRCRLYAPFQTQPMIECNFFESYTKSFEVMQNVFTVTEDAVPVAIQLCPLIVILAENEEQMAKFSYRDVDCFV